MSVKTSKVGHFNHHLTDQEWSTTLQEGRSSLNATNTAIPADDATTDAINAYMAALGTQEQKSLSGLQLYIDEHGSVEQTS